MLKDKVFKSTHDLAHFSYCLKDTGLSANL
jgi:hypothetical protein